MHHLVTNLSVRLLTFVSSLLRATVEGQVNYFRVESLKNCYEALMEYVVTHGADKNAAKSRLILQLMTRHHDLQEV